MACLMVLHSRILTLLNMKLMQITKNSVPTSHKTHYFSLTKIEMLIFFGKFVIILLKIAIIIYIYI
jgi:hypothetical protein